MLHWIPAPTVAFQGARPDCGPALAGGSARCVQSLRAMHALMLAYAGQRRRAAADPGDSAYWKAAERHALDKAQGLRAQDGFVPLP